MSPKTLEALRGSIRKWRLIVIGEGVDRGAEVSLLPEGVEP